MALETTILFLVHLAAHGVTLSVTLITSCLVVYQTLTLYVPHAMHLAIGTPFQVPAYLKDVYGPAISSGRLPPELWGYLVGAVVAIALSLKLVLPHAPWGSAKFKSQ